MSQTLETLRKEIDEVDEELLHVLSKRIRVVEKIGRFKELNGIPPLDEKRWKELLESIIERGEALKLPKHFLVKLYTQIHIYSLEKEKEAV